MLKRLVMNPWAVLKLMSGTNGLKTAELRLKMTRSGRTSTLKDDQHIENVCEVITSNRRLSAGSSRWRRHFKNVVAVDEHGRGRMAFCRGWSQLVRGAAELLYEDGWLDLRGDWCQELARQVLPWMTAGPPCRRCVSRELAEGPRSPAYPHGTWRL